MRVILDTGTLYYPEVLRRTLEVKADIVLPAVAYAERRRQIVAAGRRPADFDAHLAKARIFVEPFSRAEADRLPPVTDAAWQRLARDAMIAAHVLPGDQLWTTNGRDFLALGVPEAQIVAVP